LRSLAKDSLTVDDFVDLIRDTTGIDEEEEQERVAREAFAKLCGQCAKASQRSALDAIDEDALLALYLSPEYRYCERGGADANEAVLSLFNRFDEGKTGALGDEEIKNFLSFILPPRPAGDHDSKEEKEDDGEDSYDIAQLLKLFKSNGSSCDPSTVDKVDQELFLDKLLRCGRSSSSSSNSSCCCPGPQSSQEYGIPIDFEGHLLDPVHTSNLAFVNHIEDLVKSHPALRHHVLENLATGTFGRATSVNLLHYLEAYSHFSRGFVSYVEGLKGKVSSAEHVALLDENIDEENGHYSAEDIAMMESLGLDSTLLVGVPHRQLYSKCFQVLASSTKKDWDTNKLETSDYEFIGEPLKASFEKTCLSSTATLESAIGALYFCSEFIVPVMYEYLRQCCALHTKLSLDERAFFEIHVKMDQNHAAAMKKIVVENVSLRESRLQIVYAVHAVMNARNEFMDRLSSKWLTTGRSTSSPSLVNVTSSSTTKQPISIAISSKPPSKCLIDGTAESKDDNSLCPANQSTSTLYDKQSSAWVRQKPTCLSDFTGRPVVFDMCRPHVTNALVLDVGCGEGFCARKLVELGANRVIGVDISEEMIKKAIENPMTTSSEYYLHGDATKVRDLVMEHRSVLPTSVRTEIADGCFDLAVGVFVFNYVTISQMKSIMVDVYRLLKPGGHFVFSVPHPLMLFLHHDAGSESDATFSFDTEGCDASYFSIRDHLFSGTIRTIDQKRLNVRMMFKTFTDYLDGIKEAKLDLVDMHEAKVKSDMMALHPDFFSSVADKPLHVIFKVRKPIHVADVAHFPKKRLWYPHELRNASRHLEIAMPIAAENQLVDVVNHLFAAGVTAETFNWASTSGISPDQLSHVRELGALIRRKLCDGIGACLVRKLDLKRLGLLGVSSKHANQPTAGNDDYVIGGQGNERAKLAYYLLCSFVGDVDGSARGRLFDVRDSRAHRVNDDNVLFSVTNAEAGWHTDGASRDREYDATSLLCLNPAARGGEFKIASATNALENLKTKLPKFILYELFRPVPRDILEDGKGTGLLSSSSPSFGGKTSDLSYTPEDLLNVITRNNLLLPYRIKRNAFPIYCDRGDRMSFRYMRYWIESAHRKIGWDISPLLSIAMNALDKELDSLCCFEQSLKAGDMVFCNNKLIAHARNAFEDNSSSGDELPRHKVRAWIQIQHLHQASGADVASGTRHPL